jgi:hypothetical protein
LYAQVGIAALPKILGLEDRNRLRPTYGCFDKEYWHYKTASFPSGMYQEFVLPLALVYAHRFPGGDDYYRQENLKEWARAGIAFAAKSGHADGSCDDYFPYERALGATAFSLYACAESALVLELRDAETFEFLARRARWLATRGESGRLANHHALVAAALYNVHLVTGAREFREAAERRVTQLLEWQSAEGWFPEYEGCDPGYHSVTISWLAKYWKKSGDAHVLEPLRRAVRFAADFMHPDGSYAGTYGSRNTAIFFPHGFELLAAEMPEAAWVADQHLHGIANGRRLFLEDDRLIAHFAWEHLQAYLDYAEARAAQPPAEGARHWKEAGLYVRREGAVHAVAGLAKGGVLRVYDGQRPAYADSGIVARQADGRVLASHFVDRYETEVLENRVRVKGDFGYVKHRLPTPLKQAVLHTGMAMVGRFFSDAVRALLQKLLITGKRRAPLTFQRTIEFGAQVTLTDEIWDPRPGRAGGERLVELYAATDATSIYVAQSNAWQSVSLQPWTDYFGLLEELRRSGYAKITRTLTGPQSK